MYSANGKLLLTSEYYVLDGALALALPVKFGQTLTVQNTIKENILLWNSLTCKDELWFEATFSLPDLICLGSSDQQTEFTLRKILQILHDKDPDKFRTNGGIHFTTRLDFPRVWGLGSSSTLIWLLAQWADVDPYELLFQTIGGSGYDIACAGAVGPILYQLKKYKNPTMESIDFSPSFRQQLYFVYLGKKQNSRQGITHFRKMVVDQQKNIDRLSTITKLILSCKTLVEFNELLHEHEEIISSSLKLPKAKEIYFSDFSGVIKSLGAWGGDFILASSEMPSQKVKTYFNNKGFETVFHYLDMVK